MDKKFNIADEVAEAADEAERERADTVGGLNIQTQWSSWSRSSAYADRSDTASA
jgi:hypothetical protein